LEQYKERKITTKKRYTVRTVVNASGIGVAVRGVQDSALAQLEGLLHGQVVPPVAATEGEEKLQDVFRACTSTTTTKNWLRAEEARK